jgi:hypothetical protein
VLVDVAAVAPVGAQDAALADRHAAASRSSHVNWLRPM